jgi:Fibrinogen beta and gamma chains, C-terminal globular domain
MAFSTYDQDHDNWSTGNCANVNSGPNWFNACWHQFYMGQQILYGKLLLSTTIQGQSVLKKKQKFHDHNAASPQWNISYCLMKPEKI